MTHSDTPFDDLIHRYIEQRAGLSNDELDALIAGLRAAPERAVALREQLLIDDFISQKLAFDRRNFLAQVEQRIADFERGEEELESQIVELRTLAEGELEHPTPAACDGTWWKVALGVAAAAVLGFVVIAPRITTPTQDLLASVEQLQGSAVLASATGDTAVSAGQAISPGQTLTTPAGAQVQLRFADGTLMEVAALSTVSIEAEPTTGGKLVRLDRGEVVADVQKQRPGRPLVFATPHAFATVLGTKLRLTVGEHATRLDVTEGQVELRRKADRAVVHVSANESGFAAADNLALHQLTWPDDRSAMLFLFAGDAKSTQVRSPTNKNLLQLTELHASGAAKALPGKLELRGGSFHSREAAEDMLPLLKTAGELAVEVVLQPSAVPQGLTPILALSNLVDPAADAEASPTAGNLLLGQDEQGLLLRLRLDARGDVPREVRLGQIEPGRKVHLALAYRSGLFQAFMDGKLVAEAHDLRGGFSNWKPATELRIGNDSSLAHAWRGQIHGITILNRFVDEAEMQRNRRNYQQLYGGL